MRKKEIFAQAVVAMGYRKGQYDTFLKPFSFSTLEGKFIKEKGKNIFCITLFVPGKEKLLCWNHKDIDYLNPEEQWTNANEITPGPELFSLYCRMIASAENWVGMEHGVNLGVDDGTLAFITPYDTYHYMDI
jgi:hypothetical protein